MGRADLIGNGKQHLIPDFQPAGTGRRFESAAPATERRPPARPAPASRRPVKASAPRGKRPR
jgi:hypothetical protein